MRKLTADGFPAGTAGAGMQLEVRIAPRNVSFGFTEMLEVPGPATGITGYFVGWAAAGNPTAHHPNPRFTHIRLDNIVALHDHAFGSGFPPPWSAGNLHWTIPNNYRRTGTAGPGTFLDEYRAALLDHGRRRGHDHQGRRERDSRSVRSSPRSALRVARPR